jgi:hypothetical protein
MEKAAVQFIEVVGMGKEKESQTHCRCLQLPILGLGWWQRALIPFVD